MPDAGSTSILPGLITGALGFAGTTATLAFTWFKDRKEAADRAKLLDAATKQLDFWDKWLKFQKEINPNDSDVLQRASDIARSNTTDVAEQLTADINSLGRPIVNTKRVSIIRQYLFLYSPPHAIGYLPRFFYWLATAFWIYIEIRFNYNMHFVDDQHPQTLAINYRALTEFTLKMGGIVLMLGLLTFVLDRSLAWRSKSEL
jgi:hypothetical protein